MLIFKIYIYGINIFDFINDIYKMIKAERFAFENFKEIFFLSSVFPNFGEAIIMPSMFDGKISWYINKITQKRVIREITAGTIK